MTKTATRFVGMTSAAASLSSCTGSAARASRTCGRANSAGDRIDSAQLRRHAKRKTKTSHSRHCALWSGNTSGTTARGRTAPTSSGWTSSLTRTRPHHPPAPPGAQQPGRCQTRGRTPRFTSPTTNITTTRHGAVYPIDNLPDSWGPVTPMNHNNYCTIVVPLHHPPPDSLRLAGGGR